MGVLGLTPFIQKTCPEVIRTLPSRLKTLRGSTVVFDGTLITQRLHFARNEHDYRHILGWYNIIRELRDCDVQAICVFDGKERSRAKEMETERRRSARKTEVARAKLELERLSRLKQLHSLVRSLRSLNPEVQKRTARSLQAILSESVSPAQREVEPKDDATPLPRDDERPSTVTPSHPTMGDFGEIEMAEILTRAGVSVSASQDSDSTLSGAAPGTSKSTTATTIHITQQERLVVEEVELVASGFHPSSASVEQSLDAVFVNALQDISDLPLHDPSRLGETMDVADVLDQGHIQSAAAPGTGENTADLVTCTTDGGMASTETRKLAAHAENLQQCQDASVANVIEEDISHISDLSLHEVPHIVEIAQLVCEIPTSAVDEVQETSSSPVLPVSADVVVEVVAVTEQSRTATPAQTPSAAAPGTGEGTVDLEIRTTDGGMVATERDTAAAIAQDVGRSQDASVANVVEEDIPHISDLSLHEVPHTGEVAQLACEIPVAAVDEGQGTSPSPVLTVSANLVDEVLSVAEKSRTPTPAYIVPEPADAESELHEGEQYMACQLSQLYLQYRQSVPELPPLPEKPPKVPDTFSSGVAVNAEAAASAAEEQAEYAMSRTQHQLMLDEGQLWARLAEADFGDAESTAVAVLTEKSSAMSESYHRRTHPATQETYAECKEILMALGVPCIETMGPFEAEALASAIVINGYADYVATEDTDVLVYEAPMIRNLTSRSGPLVMISGADLRELLALDRARYIDFALLLGTDFSPRIKNVGPVRALKLIRDHGSIERVLEHAPQYRPRAPPDIYLAQVVQARLVFETLPPLPDEARLQPQEPDDEEVARIMKYYGLLAALREEWSESVGLEGNYFQDDPSAA